MDGPPSHTPASTILVGSRHPEATRLAKDKLEKSRTIYKELGSLGKRRSQWHTTDKMLTGVAVWPNASIWT